ncbi:MAG: acyl-CoA dehydrogenase family protein, partial [Gammaproteobacteria bacterium]
QGLNWILAEVATNLEAAAALTRDAIACAERGDDPTLAAAHAKKFATRVAFDGVAECMQAMGAAGYGAGYPLARHLAAAKMAQFLDGTTQIQNVVIARSLKTHYAKA